MTKAISIFSCANELHKIAIIRWRIAAANCRSSPARASSTPAARAATGGARSHEAACSCADAAWTYPRDSGFKLTAVGENTRRFESDRKVEQTASQDFTLLVRAGCASRHWPSVQLRLLRVLSFCRRRADDRWRRPSVPSVTRDLIILKKRRWTRRWRA